MARKQETASEAVKFSKDKIMTSSKYADRKDILQAILSEEKKYTLDEVDTAIETFMKGKVK